MKVPNPPVSYTEVKYNLDHGIMELVEKMLEEKEKAELERNSE